MMLLLFILIKYSENSMVFYQNSRLHLLFYFYRGTNQAYWCEYNNIFQNSCSFITVSMFIYRRWYTFIVTRILSHPPQKKLQPNCSVLEGFPIIPEFHKIDCYPLKNNYWSILLLGYNQMIFHQHIVASEKFIVGWPFSKNCLYLHLVGCFVIFVSPSVSHRHLYA